MLFRSYLIGLSKKGITITLISFEKEARYKALKSAIENSCQIHNIEWLPLPYTKYPPILSTLKDIFKLNKTVKEQLRTKQIDLIHCRSYITALVGLGIKQKQNIPFFFDMRGFWANERIDGNIWNLNNPLFKWVFNYFKNKEKEFFSQANYSVSLTHAGKQEIESWKLPHQAPIEVIPCCTDTNIFAKDKIKKEQANGFKQALNISDNDYILSYLGSVGTWYMLNEMLDFFKTLLKTKPNAKFLFISQDNPNEIKRKAEEKGI